MSTESVDISSLVAFLKMRKERNTVLVLGSRTGAFFRSQDLQAVTALYSMLGLALNSFSPEDRFKETYAILTQGQFGPDEIDTILTTSLMNVDVTENDLLLAEIIKQEWFDVLISTNVDNTLEQLLERIGMKELHDFDVFCPTPDTQKGLQRAKKTFPCKIIKVFGELRTGNYIIKRDGYLTGNQAIADLLKDELQKDIIAFGLDPVWDAEVFRVLPSQGGSIWLVSDKQADENPLLRRPEQQRQIKYLVCTEDHYEDCIRELHNALKQEVSSTRKENVSIRKDSDLLHGVPSPASMTGRIPSKENVLEALDDVRSSPIKILGLGTRNDTSVFEALREHLIGLTRRKIIGTCEHRLVSPNMNTAHEIDARLKDATIVLPLISSEFMGIYDGSIELQHIMELSVARKLRVIPILVRDYDLAGTVFEKLTPLPDNRKPVMLWKNRDSALVNISKGIRKVAEELRGS